MDYSLLSTEELIKRIRELESNSTSSTITNTQINTQTNTQINNMQNAQMNNQTNTQINTTSTSKHSSQNNTQINSQTNSQTLTTIDPLSFMDPPSITKLQHSTSIQSLTNFTQINNESNDPSTPAIFEDVDPDKIISELKKCQEVGTNRKKEFYKTYSKWSTLRPDQKNNVVTWFKNLNEDTRKQVLDSCRRQVVEQRKSLSNTTKDDIVRLFHLNRHPEAIIHWSHIKGILTRQQLDARNSDSDAAEAANPWDALATIFNDYKNFCPQNLMVKYVVGADGNPEKIMPIVPEEEWQHIYLRCQDLEPTNRSRAQVIRDGNWIKLHWTEMRGILSKLFNKYYRSGQHSAKGDWNDVEELKAWESHSLNNANTFVRFPTACVYSVCVFEKNDFYSMNRQMEEGAGIDRSLRTPNPERTELEDSEKRRFKKMKQSKENMSEAMLKMREIEEQMKNAASLECLKYCILYGSKFDYKEFSKGSATNMATMAWKKIASHCRFPELFGDSNNDYTTPKTGRELRVSSGSRASSAMSGYPVDSVMDLTRNESDNVSVKSSSSDEDDDFERRRFEQRRASIFKDSSDDETQI